MEIGDLFKTMQISALALQAEKAHLAVTAENIANANTTRTENGTPYKRKVLVKRAIQQRPLFSNFLDRANLSMRTSNANHIRQATYEKSDFLFRGFADIQLDIVEKNQTKKIFDPNHPDADAQGFVEYPDINVVSEMLELITASRSYEANLTVMEAAKNLARRSLEI